jgi:hypothetical protein
MTAQQQQSISTRLGSDWFVELPDEETVADTVAGLERRGFSADVVGDLDAARQLVLGRIPVGTSVVTFPSVTLQETGIAQAIQDDERYGSARAKVLALDRASQMQEIKAIVVLADFALGSVQAITRDGTLVLASALGSQLAAYAWGAANVILVVGMQKLVPDLVAAHERIDEHCLKLEDIRAREAYGQGSRVGKILELYEEDRGRIHVVLIRQRVGF